MIGRTFRAVVALVLTLGALWAPGAMAAEDGGTEPTQFVAATHQEKIDGGPFLLAAYAVIWAGLFLYLWSLQRRQAKLESDVATLRDALTRYDAGKGAGPKA